MEPIPEHLRERPTLGEYAQANYAKIKKIESDVGSVVNLVGALEYAYFLNPGFRANVFQLERMSKVLVLTNRQSKQNYDMAEGFYWGELLGMAVGHQSIDDGYAKFLYDYLNIEYYYFHDTYTAPSPNLTPKESIEMQAELNELMVEKYFERIDRQEAKLPKPYIEMIDDWVPQLKTSDRQEYYIKAGFVYIASKPWEAFEDSYHTETIKRSISSLRGR